MDKYIYKHTSAFVVFVFAFGNFRVALCKHMIS